MLEQEKMFSKMKKSTRCHSKAEGSKAVNMDEDDRSDSDMEELAGSDDDRMKTDDDSSVEGEGSEASPVNYVIDKSGGSTSGPAPTYHHDDDSESESDSEESEPEQQTGAGSSKKSGLDLSCSLQPDIDTSKLLYLNTDLYAQPQLRNKNITDLMLNTKGSEMLKKSVLTSDLEKKTELLPYEQSVRKLKKQRREERAKTKGQGWFDMKAPEMTEEKKNDLMVLKMRRSLNPKQFYKAPDLKGLPKYFQMGTVVDSPVDFYRDRIPKKQRKQTLVDELLADAQFRKYNKKKYTEIMESKMRRSRGAHKHMKRLKKRKK